MLACPAARALACVVVSVVLSQTGLGQEAKQKALSPNTRRLLEQVVRVYREGAAYSDEGTIQIEYVSLPANGFEKPKRGSATARLAFARPNKLALKYGSLRIICDGNALTTVIDANKRYFVATAPKAITLELFRQDPMRNYFSETQMGRTSLFF